MSLELLASPDYWFYELGLNIVPATKEGKPKIKWVEDWHLDKWALSVKKFNELKEQGWLDDGFAIVMGKSHRGKYEGQYVIALDADNGLVPLCDIFNMSNIQELAQRTIVEQRADAPHKAHIYFVSPVPMFAGNRITSVLEIHRKGLMYPAPNSSRKTGVRYEIIGTNEPMVLSGSEAWTLRDKILSLVSVSPTKQKVSPKLGMKKSNKNKTRREDYWKVKRRSHIVTEGNGRHNDVLYICESLIDRLYRSIPLDDIRTFAFNWNLEHCSPPLSSKEFAYQWKSAREYILGRGKGYVQSGKFIRAKNPFGRSRKDIEQFICLCRADKDANEIFNELKQVCPALDERVLIKAISKVKGVFNVQATLVSVVQEKPLPFIHRDRPNRPLTSSLVDSSPLTDISLPDNAPPNLLPDVLQPDQKQPSDYGSYDDESEYSIEHGERYFLDQWHQSADTVQTKSNGKKTAKTGFPSIHTATDTTAPIAVEGSANNRPSQSIP